MDDTRPRGRRTGLKARLRARLRGRPLTLLRRALAAALLLVAAALAATPGAGGEKVLPTLVTARDVSSGSALSISDVRLVDMDADSRPDGALTDPAQAVHRRLAGAARAGEPITDVRLVGSNSGPPGHTTVPLRLADPGIADLLSPGTRVDVVVPAETDEAEVLARSATVVTVAQQESARVGGPLGQEEAPLVLVSVADEHAPRVAAAGLDRPVTVILR
ncbi:SAF domain-containing protein [Saccharomonospora xinjiangensis]|uniref:SAF domain-containing protein n=1 Tax=Saccharomonospora xinjiangensis TaxID=75294 RepID=UPI00106FA0B0|nr:SAF domain-containing protein [Saccharomonospora xinjiangensis]QBQ61990.1 flagellar basal body P-ring biosynthesis protein FlgA [Saccharomonospora xinjiangensis]